MRVLDDSVDVSVIVSVFFFCYIFPQLFFGELLHEGCKLFGFCEGFVYHIVPIGLRGNGRMIEAVLVVRIEGFTLENLEYCVHIIIGVKE